MAGTPIVLIHGYWHGSWCYTPLIAELTERGRQAIALDLAGHGLNAVWPSSAFARPFDPAAFATEVSPMAGVTLDDAGDLLVSQVRKIFKGQKVVLVGHSMSGAVITNAAQKAPELFERIVYLTAFMPVIGLPAAAYIQDPANEGEMVAPSLCADPATVACLRFDTNSPDPEYRKKLRDAFYHDVDPQLADAAINLICDDAPIGIAAGVTECTADGWGSIPRTYIICTEDQAIRLNMQRKFIEDADAAFPANKTDVVELPSAHSPFLNMPERLADYLAGI